MEEDLNTVFDTCEICKGIFGVLMLTYCMLLFFSHTQRTDGLEVIKYISLLQESLLSPLLRSSLKPEIRVQNSFGPLC